MGLCVPKTLELPLDTRFPELEARRLQEEHQKVRLPVSLPRASWVLCLRGSGRVLAGHWQGSARPLARAGPWPGLIFRPFSGENTKEFLLHFRILVIGIPRTKSFEEIFTRFRLTKRFSKRFSRRFSPKILVEISLSKI